VLPPPFPPPQHRYTHICPGFLCKHHCFSILVRRVLAGYACTLFADIPPHVLWSHLDHLQCLLVTQQRLHTKVCEGEQPCFPAPSCLHNSALNPGTPPPPYTHTQTASCTLMPCCCRTWIISSASSLLRVTVASCTHETHSAQHSAAQHNTHAVAFDQE
jgi:hypothetical protein